MRHTRSAATATQVANKLTIKVAPTISAGLTEPAADRRAMIVAGTKVNPVVHRARSVHIAGEAVSLFGLSFCSSCMALMPKGVTALPKPSMLALTVMTIAPIAGWLRGTLENKTRITGLSSRAKKRTIPACSAIFKTPSHKHITPINLKASATASSAALIALFVTISMRPFTAAQMIPATIKNIQTKLITSHHPH